MIKSCHSSFDLILNTHITFRPGAINPTPVENKTRQQNKKAKKKIETNKTVLRNESRNKNHIPPCKNEENLSIGPNLSPCNHFGSVII